MPQRPLEPLIRNLETESQLGDDEREAVRQLPFTVRNIPAGGDIVRERENPSQCCVVLEGWLCRHKITLGGARQIFSFHIAGDIPDLQSLHLKTMDHTLSAVTPSIVGLIQHDDLRALDAAFPRLGDILWRNTLIDAAIFREWINGMGRREAPERIAHLLCELFVRMRAVGLTKGNSCQFPLTQSVLGDALGLSTVHINRSLMELRGLGLIILEKHGLTIPNLEKLEEYASFDPLYLHSSMSKTRNVSTSRGHRPEAHRLPVREWPDEGMAEDEEPGFREVVSAVSRVNNSAPCSALQ